MHWEHLQLSRSHSIANWVSLGFSSKPSDQITLTDLFTLRYDTVALLTWLEVVARERYGSERRFCHGLFAALPVKARLVNVLVVLVAFVAASIC